MRRALVLIPAVLIVLIAVLIARTLLSRSSQVAGEQITGPAFDSGAVAQHLAAAVRFPTVSHTDGSKFDGGAFRAFASFLEETYPRTHAALKRQVISDYSLLYTWPGADASLPPALFAAHMDVVPVDPASETRWSHAPFGGEIADGYLYGRGTLDDKVSVISIFEAVEALLAAGHRPSRTVYLAFGHDEELSGHGAGEIAKELASQSVKLDFALDEGSFVTTGIVPGVRAPVAAIATAEKGYVDLELTVEGTGGHSSTPPPRTAVGILAEAVSRVERNQMPAAIVPPETQFFDRVAPEMPFGLRLALTNLWLTRPLVTRMLAGSPITNAVLRTTTAPTMLEGSPKSNVLATRARAVINFRLRPGDRIQDVIDHVRRTVDDPAVGLRTLQGSEASPVSDLSSPSGVAIQRAVRGLFPASIAAPSVMIGAADARFYAPLAANTYRFLPLQVGSDVSQRLHGIDERVAIENLERAVKFYAALMR